MRKAAIDRGELPIFSRAPPARAALQFGPIRAVEWAADRLPRGWGYGQATVFGVTLAVVASLLQVVIHRTGGTEQPFLTYFPAVVIASGVAGWVAGAAALATASVLSWWLLVDGAAQGMWRTPDLLSFIATAAFAGAAAAFMNTAVRGLSREREATRSANLALRAAEEHARRFVELTPQIAWTANVKEGVTAFPERLAELTGVPQERLLGDGWAAIVHPNDLAGLLEAWRVAQQTGEPLDHEHRIRLADGSYRWLRSRAYPLREPGGRVTIWYGLSEDVDERRAAEHAREVLASEVDHRARNLLSVVQSVARLMPRAEPEAFVETFLGRLSALAAAHGLMAENSWQAVGLDQLVERELQPFTEGQPDKLDLRGPPVRLSPAWVQSWGMALHELATNSAKYGALSAPSGRVIVRWRLLDAPRRLRFEWIEEGGPPVARPTRTGFGTRLIEKNLRLGRNCDVRFEWPRSGIRVTIDVGAEGLAHEREDPSTSGREQTPYGRASGGAPTSSCC